MTNGVNSNSEIWAYQTNTRTKMTAAAPVDEDRPGMKRIHISEFDNVAISDEARKMYADGNFNEISEKERIAIAIENRRAKGIDAPEHIFMWDESQTSQPPMKHLNNLGGFKNITAQNGQEFSVILRGDGIWIAQRHNAERGAFQLIDPSKGTPGIPQSTVRELDYTMRIIQNTLSSDGRFLFDNSDMRENLQAAMNAFAALHEELGINPNSEKHAQFLETAFRDVLRNFFDEAARNDEWRKVDNGQQTLEQWQERQKSATWREEARERSNAFSDVFFQNLRSHGINAAFDLAWSAMQSSDT